MLPNNSNNLTYIKRNTTSDLELIVLATNATNPSSPLCRIRPSTQIEQVIFLAWLFVTWNSLEIETTLNFTNIVFFTGRNTNKSPGTSNTDVKI